MHARWYHFTETRIVSEGEEPEVNVSSFTNTSTFLTSSGSITIYVPRAFQRAVPNPLVLPYVTEAQHLVSLERYEAMSNIRICSSSYVWVSKIRLSDLVAFLAISAALILSH